MFPFENLALRHSSHGLNLAAGLLIMLQLSAIPFYSMGLGKLVRTSRCARSLEYCESIGGDIPVHIICCPQQAISRRYEWTRADNGLDSTSDRTGCFRIAVCILTGEEHIGGKLCVLGDTRHCVGWARRRFTTPEEHVET